MKLFIPEKDFYNQENPSKNTFIPIEKSVHGNILTYLNGRKNGLIKVMVHNNVSANPNWGLHLSDHDYIWYYDEHGMLISMNGYFVPRSEKGLKWESHYFAAQIPFGESHTYYIAFENQLNTRFKKRPHVIDLNDEVSRKLSKTRLDFLFQGVLLILIIYNLGFYVYSREMIHLYYALFILFSSIFYLYLNGHFRELVLAENPQLMNYPSYSVPIMFVFFILFIQSFLGKKIIDTRKKVLTKSIIWLNLIGTTLIIIHYNLTGNQYVSAIIIRGLAGLDCLFILIAISTLYLRNQLRGHQRFIFYGVTIFVSMAILEVILWQFNNQAKLAQIGYIGQIILFSFGLGEKVRSDIRERQKAKDSLIDSLKENEQLVRKKKEDLEEIIHMRTQEIELRNLELQKAKEDAEEASRSKSDFLSVMSHEIRTPMNAVVGLIHLLSEENKDQSLEDYLRTLKYSSESLMIIINDVLDYSKIESGQVSIENRVFQP